MGMQHSKKSLAIQNSVDGAGGEASTLEIVSQGLSRRQVLLQAIGGALALVGSEMISGCSSPNPGGQADSLIDAGPKSQFQPSLPLDAMLDKQGIFYVAQARAYLVHLAADTPFLLSEPALDQELDSEFWVKDSDGTYWLALYQNCTHLNCRIPFRDDCHSFKCPCHGSHFNIDGEYLDGPAPRNLDRFLLSFQNEHVMIDTSKIKADVPRPDPQMRLVSADGTECSA